ncbi:Transcriptional regulator [Minicystis rosea]|nr:Transcriptional regulator [Minicystis rosea]
MPSFREWIAMIASITTVNLAQLDLNLLVTLAALLEERSVTRAGQRLGLSQPAVSNALARLREVLGDPLLVRNGSRMVPTPRALEMAPLLREALAAVERAVALPAAFAPRSATDRFTLAATDYFEMVLLPAIVARVSAEAPRVSLDVRPIGESSPLPAIASGEMDGALGVFFDLPSGFRKKALGHERFTCVLRRGHPALKRKKSLDLATYAALPHVLVAPRRTGPGAVDNALAAQGLSRHVALTVSHFLVAPLVVSQTDLVATLPERAARLLAGELALELITPPVSLSGFEFCFLWHDRTHDSAPHRWLRTAIAPTKRRGNVARDDGSAHR